MGMFSVGFIVAILSIATSQAEDVNKNLPIYCQYPKGDVTFMECQKADTEIFRVLKQLRELSEEERLRVTHFKLFSLDNPALRSRTFAMFPNLKKLELHPSRTYSCAADALQGIPKLEDLFFNIGDSPAFHIDGLFDNLTLKHVKFGRSCFSGQYDLTPIYKSLKQYKIESFETSGWRFPWKNLTDWFQGQYLKKLTMNSLHYFFDTFEKPIDSKDYFNEFINLESLQLSGSMISYIVDGAFRFLKKLTSLNLKSNWLRGVTPGMFEGLDSLTTLDMSYNFLTVIAIEDFGNFLSLDRHLTVNVKRNKFECGCDLIQNAYDFKNSSDLITLKYFECNSPQTKLKGAVLSTAVLESNLTTECLPPTLTGCCPTNPVTANWDLENKLEINCRGAGIPMPRILCVPTVGGPKPYENQLYYEKQTHNSHLIRWYHAQKSDAGKYKCTATNSAGTVTEECTIEVEKDWPSAGTSLTPGAIYGLTVPLLAIMFFGLI